MPDLGDGDIALIVDDRHQVENSERGQTTILESDTEMTTQQRGARVMLNKPPEYDLTLAQAIARRAGEAARDRLMTGDGDVEALQVRIWELRAEQGDITLDQLHQEADLTGHEVPRALHLQLLQAELHEAAAEHRQRLVAVSNS